MRVLDPNGVWLTNKGQFPIYDPETGVTLPPGEKVQAIYSGWAKGQPTIVPDKPEAEAPAPAPAPASKKA